MTLINNKRTDAELLRIEGVILDESAFDALAVVSDTDIEQLAQQWAMVVPQRYVKLIEAESNDKQTTI